MVSLVPDVIAQKMLAYAAYALCSDNARVQPVPLGGRLNSFDRVAQMLNGCSIASHVGGRQVPRIYEWAEVASNAYRDFPFTNDQMRQMSILRHQLRKTCSN